MQWQLYIGKCWIRVLLPCPFSSFSCSFMKIWLNNRLAPLGLVSLGNPGSESRMLFRGRHPPPQIDGFFFCSTKLTAFFCSTGIVTARKRSFRRLCFHWCLSVHGGSAHTLPRASTPRASTPLGRPPQGWEPPGRHPLPLGRHPPAQCMLGYGQQAGGTHPTGMHSCSSCCWLCE